MFSIHCFVFILQIYMALPQPSHMIEKSGLKVTVELLPSLINMVIPVGISRTVLNRGVQVINHYNNDFGVICKLNTRTFIFSVDALIQNNHNKSMKQKMLIINLNCTWLVFKKAQFKVSGTRSLNWKLCIHRVLSLIVASRGKEGQWELMSNKE